LGRREDIFEGSGDRGAARERRWPASCSSQNQAPEEWDPPIPVYDPFGPGTTSDEFIDD
jgi:hypothetical protein